MKKLILSLAVAAVFTACDNAADTGSNAKDSLDSIANAKKEIIDSTAEQRKEIVDSTIQQQKEILDRKDSLENRRDSATR